MIRKVIFTIAILCLFSSFASAVNAVDNIAYEQINPSNSYSYNLKRLKEKISLVFFYRTPVKKVNFLKTLFSRRIAELKYTVDNKDIVNIQTASQRYSTTAGQMTEIVTKNNLNSEKEYLKNLFSEQVSLIEKWQAVYKYDSAEWLFLKWDIDYLKLYSEKLSS